MGLVFGPKVYVHIQENQIQWIENLCSRIVAGDTSSRESKFGSASQALNKRVVRRFAIAAPQAETVFDGVDRT